MAGALWLAVTLYETLRPVGWVQSIPFWSFWVATMAGVDMVQNIVLFAPMGWIANRGGWSGRRTVIAALLLSAGIEFVQQWIPGRASVATDIAFNVTGAVLGWWMATPVRRPRVRVAVALVVLATFLGVHALNTSWPGEVAAVDGADAWQGVTTKPCLAGLRASTVCLEIPNAPKPGRKFILVVGASVRTYARVQGGADGRSLGRADCVLTSYESTIGALMRFRPPLSRACAVADSTNRVIDLRVDPRLEYTARGAWEPTRIGVWMWPAWPFGAYRPVLLRAAGAMAFVVGAALLAGMAPWWIPAAYLVMLSTAAFMTGMRGPGLWELGWTAAAWLVALAVVTLDARWRRAA